MPGEALKKKLVVLDRDGVINHESPDFVKSADEWIPLDGSIDAIAALTRGGFRVAVASNQSGLARGLFDYAALYAMHQKMRDLVSAAGGRIDHIVICPHGPDDGCDCRKPRPGLLLQVGKHFDMEMQNVPFIGDSVRDLLAARAAAARPILVRTGNGRKAEGGLPPELSGVEVFDDLPAAAAALLSE
jgi:D-glycero-D-manno-heptose 1,7-bisphosphate phosphatase